MRRFLCFVVLLGLMTSSCWAQTATATGTGTGVANSRSASQAVAIGGGSAAGGNSAANLTINNPANTSQTVSGTQTLRNVPTVFAPGLAAAGLETCLGSVSAGVGVIGTGVSFGTTVPDASCAARLDARTLWSMGLKKAAVARLCLTPDIARSMPEVCVQYLPQQPGYPVLASDATVVSAEYTGGPVEVVVQKTGEHRTCNDYDVTRHRCRVWAR